MISIESQTPSPPLALGVTDAFFLTMANSKPLPRALHAAKFMLLP